MKSLFACLACLALGACFAAPDGASPVASASIGPEGGQLRSVDGKLTLQIPAGALAKVETITVATSSSSPIPAQASALGGAYTIGPAGLELESPAEVTLAVSSTAHGDGEALGVFEATDGSISVVALPTQLQADGTLTAEISGAGDVQAARYILLNPTTGSTSATSGTGAAGSSSGTTSGGNTSGATIAGSSSGATTGGATTGGGTSTGSTGQTAYCGGAAGTTGGPGQLQGCQLISQYCSGSGQDEVDCTQGDCRCLRQGQPFAWVQEPTNDCSQAWSDCGLPPGSVPGGVGGTTGASGPVGGTATVQGAVAFSGQANGFTTSSGTATYALEVSLTQDGLCGGYEATGYSLFIGLSSDAAIAPGSYSVGGEHPQPGMALIAVRDWNDATGDHGVVGYATEGTLTLDSVDGAQVSGSFDANFDLGGGTSQAITGSFSAVPACAP